MDKFEREIVGYYVDRKKEKVYFQGWNPAAVDLAIWAGPIKLDSDEPHPNTTGPWLGETGDGKWCVYFLMPMVEERNPLPAEDLARVEILPPPTLH